MILWWAHKNKQTKMATLTQFSVDSLDLTVEEMEIHGTVAAAAAAATNTAVPDGSDSGLDTASLSNTSYELLRGISCNSADYDANVPTADLLGLSPPPQQHVLNLACDNFEKMRISQTAARPMGHKSTPKANAEKAKNLQRAASLSRAQRATKPITATNDAMISKSLMRQSQSLCSNNTRSLQRTPSLARTRQLSTARSVIDTGRRLSSINGVATLPRSCRQKSVDDLSSQNSRSSSVARDTSTRMYNSMLYGQLPLTRKNLMNTSYGGSSCSSDCKRVKPPPPRTTIYHETSTQTVLTQCYLEEMLSAGRDYPQLSTNELLSCEQHTQTYIRDQELEQAQQSEQLLGEALEAERKQRQDVEQRLLSLGNMALSLRANISSSTTTLDGVQKVHDVNAALLLLESLFKLSGCELKERQQECTEMRSYCCTLQQSLKQCMEAQHILIQENKEHTELQDFIQHEKTSMEVQLRHIETENQTHKKQLEERNAEIRILRGECCHLVRLNEQRRYIYASNCQLLLLYYSTPMKI